MKTQPNMSHDQYWLWLYWLVILTQRGFWLTWVRDENYKCTLKYHIYACIKIGKKSMKEKWICWYSALVLITNTDVTLSLDRQRHHSAEDIITVSVLQLPLNCQGQRWVFLEHRDVGGKGVGAGLQRAVDARVWCGARVGVRDCERDGDLGDDAVHDWFGLVSNSVGHEVEADAGIGSFVDGAYGYIFTSGHSHALKTAWRGPTVFPGDCHSLWDAGRSDNKAYNLELHFDRFDYRKHPKLQCYLLEN